MDFYGIGTAGATSVAAYFYRPGSTDVSNLQNYDARSIPFNFTDYYAQPTIKYSSTAAVALTQILQQKYIALFRQAGLESYYTYRRTGIPASQLAPALVTADVLHSGLNMQAANNRPIQQIIQQHLPHNLPVWMISMVLCGC